jgi:hypothetical protein
VARDHAGPARRAPDERLEQRGGGGVEVGERLVEEQQLGVVQHRARGRDALDHPARQHGDGVVRARRHADGVEDLVDARELHVVQARVEAQVLPRREVAVEHRLVREQPDAPAHRPALAGQLAPEDPHRPGVRPQETRQHAQERRLAGAVGSEHHERGADRHGQRDVAEGGALAEAAAEPLQLNGRLAHGRRG